MFKEWEDKPRNGNFILLDISGDINNPVLCTPKPYYTSRDATNICCTVYNVDTNSMSTKTAYLQSRTGRLYLKSKYGRIYLDEFKQTEVD